MPKLKKLRLSKDLPGVNLYRRDKFAFVFRNTGLTRKRVLNHAVFGNTRRKAAAFAYASKTAGRLYRALLPEAAAWNGKDCYHRILAQTLKGAATPGPALHGFPCNPHSFPQPILHAVCSLSYHPAEQMITALIPSLHPIKDINAPLGATHFTLSLTIKTWNTITGAKQSVRHEHPVFYRLNRMKTKSIKLKLPETNDAGLHIAAIAGIAFYTSSGDDLYTFNNRKSDVMDIIRVHILQPARQAGSRC